MVHLFNFKVVKLNKKYTFVMETHKKQLDLVNQFLDDFKVKLSIWGIFFRSDRSKNTQTLLYLEISITKVKEVLYELSIEHYSAGPISEQLYGGSPMWIFGIKIKGQEIYIKINMGLPGMQVICISFHISEHPMLYPFKNN
jgi:hypothetical protein